MDVAGDNTPPDTQLAVGTLQQPSPDPVQVHDEIQKLENEAHQEDPLIQGPKDNADQECDANENGILKNQYSVIAAKADKASISGEESSMGQKERLVVKLKYKTNTKNTTTSSSPVHPRSADGTSTGLKLDATSKVVPSPSSGSPVVKQHARERQHIASPNSEAIGPQIEIEKSGDDGALALEPLNEPTEELGQVSIIKHEPDHAVRQEVDHLAQGIVRDQMGVAARVGDQAMRVPGNDDIVNKPLDIAGARAAALQPGKLQESMTIDERCVDDVGGGHEQSESALPEAARGDNTALDDGDNMSDEIDLNEWSSGVVNKDHKNQPTVDYPLASSGFTFDQMNVQRQDQVEQFPQISNTGQSELGAQDIWSQPQPDFSDPIHFTNKSSSPHYKNSPISTHAITWKGFSQPQAPQPRHVSQQPSGQYNQPNFGPDFDRRQQLQAQIEERKQQLEDLRKQNEERSQQSPYGFGYPRRQSTVPPSFVTGPLTYPRAPQFSNQQVENGLNSTGFQYSTLPTITYSQVPPNMSFSINPASLYKSTAKASAPPDFNSWMLGQHVSQGPQNMRTKMSDDNNCGDEGDASDDDEPLRSRVKRHPSVTSSRDSVIGASHLPIASDGAAQHSQQDDDSSVEFIASVSKPNGATPKASKDQVRKSQPISQPIPCSSAPPNNASPSSENAEEIDWTLPQYEVQRQPLAKGEDIPSAKVSLPGLVREEILLSPDHADDEVHLLMNVFIPNQRALPNPDPEPAIALLNFHTIAVMVIEAYVQYEIGDEFGTGRGHFHTEHNRSDADYERMRDAVDADTNEIFFAVVDRYRAGLESKKKALQLIRGTQEFCDLALDLIFYIKDHGLFRPEPEVKAARADKGVKRGPRGGAKAEEAKGKGTKRGTTAKPNEMQSRKKAKTAPMEAKKKKRSKPNTPGITVLKR